MGELMSQLYVIACGRFIRNFIDTGSCNYQQAIATGLYYNQGHFYKCSVSVPLLSDVVGQKMTVTITPFLQTATVEVVCYMLNSLAN